MSEDLLPHQQLSPEQISDIRLASSLMTGPKRRSFQAQMALKYCRGRARLSEIVFGWQRQTVALGLAEKRSGITCVAAHRGSKRGEEQQPKAAEALLQLAEAHAQQDPTFESTIAYTRLTAAQLLAQMRCQGFSKTQLSSPSTMAQVLNRMGYRLRKVVKAKPKKIARDRRYLGKYNS